MGRRRIDRPTRAFARIVEQILLEGLAGCASRGLDLGISHRLGDGRADDAFSDGLILGLRLGNVYRCTLMDEREKFRRGIWVQTNAPMRVPGPGLLSLVPATTLLPFTQKP
jgi:hypothetical protein